MTSEQTQQSDPQTEQVRRRGDRRVANIAVTEDRRKGDRRDIPGVGALMRTLFRREPSSDA